MAKLYIVRHGKSEWNLLGKWTGWTDVHIIEEGKEEARKAGTILKDIQIHSAHLSELVRTHETFEELEKELLQKVKNVKKHKALNERHYGVHTGKNKWEVKEEIGEEDFMNIRRGWDVHIPEGETLKMVHDRVVPYFQTEILPELCAGHNVLIVSHGNTLRALVKYLDEIGEEDIGDVEIGTGEVHEYEFENDKKICKNVLVTNEWKHKV